MSQLRLALAGDTMLGRKVANAIRREAAEPLVDARVVDCVREATLFVLNLECCIAERGERWPDPAKPFFFRAPAAATEVLIRLGVDCVTLANNHALDYGPEGLLETLERLESAGIASVGAGAHREQARAPATFERNGFRLAVLGCSDHPPEYAAGAVRPLRPRRLPRRLRGRSKAAQRPGPALPRRSRPARADPARGRAAEARVLPHAARRRRRRKVDRPPLPRRL
jgi:hypothetical protein